MPNFNANLNITTGRGDTLTASKSGNYSEIFNIRQTVDNTNSCTLLLSGRKDAGVANPKRSPAGRSQQPTRERGSAALSAKAAQKKAYLERKAREKGAKTKTASELLAKKEKPKTDPNYKPRKASGYTRPERKALYRKGERVLRDIRLKNLGKTKESELKHKVTSK